MKKRSEYTEQCAVIDYCDVCKIPIFAIPNGGSRNAIEAAHLKRSGVKAGVPDLFIPLAKSGRFGLFVELKYGKNKQTEKQKEWQERLLLNGYMSVVCYSADEAIKLINDYIHDKAYSNEAENE